MFSCEFLWNFFEQLFLQNTFGGCFCYWSINISNETQENQSFVGVTGTKDEVMAGGFDNFHYFHKYKGNVNSPESHT